MPVKTNGKWLPVENVFSSLQDIWHLAERWEKDLWDDLTKECWKLEPDFEHSYNRIGPVAEDNRVSYLTGTTRFINFYGRIINHFEHHYSTDHRHHNGSSNHLTSNSQDEVGRSLAPSEEPVYFQQTGCSTSSATIITIDSDAHSGGGD